MEGSRDGWGAGPARGLRRHMRPGIAGIPWMETGEVMCSRFGQATLLPLVPSFSR